MTENTQMEEDVIGDLHGDENNVEEAHDPKNAETQAVKAVDAAGNATKSAPKRKGDKDKKDPPQKIGSAKDAGAHPTEGTRLTKAGMINAAYQKMNGMKKEELADLYAKVMMEDSEESETVSVEASSDVKVDVDWSADLKALTDSEATLSEEFKGKAETIFEAAINSKVAEEIDRLEEKYNEELAAEVKETKDGLVDKVDSYLNYVVENWMKENKVAIQTGLRTEIAEKFMNNLKDLFTESYIEVPESKVDLVDNLAAEVEELEVQLNDQTGKSIAMAEQLEGYKKEAIIREASKDLAETQIEKLKSLVEKIDFEDEESFTKKVSTVKESYFNKKASAPNEIEELEEEASDEVETTGSMSQYVNALKTQIKS